MTTPPNSSLSVDRTRAIEQAAREFVAEFGIVEEGGLAVFEYEPSKQTESMERAGAAFLAALALPEPEWTTTPPKEPGTYLVTRSGQVFTLQLTERGTFEDCCFEETPETMQRDGYRFWPVPLTPPPA